MKGLLIFILLDGIVNDTPSNREIAGFVLDDRRSYGDVQIEIVVPADVAYCPRIDMP